MSTYAELKSQAEELLKQANELRDQERGRVLADVRQVIDEWGFTVNELGFRRGRASRTRLPAKYRDPLTGKEWCGKGAMPRWLSAYLDAGHTREQYLI